MSEKEEVLKSIHELYEMGSGFGEIVAKDDSLIAFREPIISINARLLRLRLNVERNITGPAEAVISVIQNRYSMDDFAESLAKAVDGTEVLPELGSPYEQLYKKKLSREELISFYGEEFVDEKGEDTLNSRV